jgi:hypothetical protein
VHWGLNRVSDLYTQVAAGLEAWQATECRLCLSEHRLRGSLNLPFFPFLFSTLLAPRLDAAALGMFVFY